VNHDERVAAALEQVVRSRKVPAIIIAAPPRTLADLRRVLHADVKARIVAEVNKDLTNHPVSEIETHLLGSGRAGRECRGLTVAEPFRQEKLRRPMGLLRMKRIHLFYQKLISTRRHKRRIFRALSRRISGKLPPHRDRCVTPPLRDSRLHSLCLMPEACEKRWTGPSRGPCQGEIFARHARRAWGFTTDIRYLAGGGDSSP